MLMCLTVAHSYMEVDLEKSTRDISHHDEVRYNHRDDARYNYHDDARHHSSSR